MHVLLLFKACYYSTSLLQLSFNMFWIELNNFYCLFQRIHNKLFKVHYFIIRLLQITIICSLIIILMIVTSTDLNMFYEYGKMGFECTFYSFSIRNSLIFTVFHEEFWLNILIDCLSGICEKLSLIFWFMEGICLLIELHLLLEQKVFFIRNKIPSKMSKRFRTLSCSIKEDLKG